MVDTLFFITGGLLCLDLFPLVTSEFFIVHLTRLCLLSHFTFGIAPKSVNFFRLRQYYYVCWVHRSSCTPNFYPKQFLLGWKRLYNGIKSIDVFVFQYFIYTTLFILFHNIYKYKYSHMYRNGG